MSSALEDKSGSKGEQSKSHVHVLAKSISLDEDEGLDETTSMEAESFLESYEEMLRLQKDELALTLRHLEPLLELLEGKSSLGNAKGGQANAPFTKEFCYRDLKHALKEIEEDESLRFVASDLQWSLVLKLLTENDISEEERISWAEVVMCYRTCIVGMQALEQTPRPKELRNRVRQRSLQMLSSFKGTGLGNVESGVTKNLERRTTFEWMDALFICGALLLLGAVAFSAVERTMDTYSANVDKNPFGSLLRAPLIPGPHVMPYSLEDMVIPGPHVSPHLADAMMVPGPKVIPFYVQDAEGSTNPTAVPLESHISSSPTAVRERSGKNSRKSIRKQPKRKMVGTLQSNLQKPVSSLDNRTAKKGLAVVAIAGSAAAAGVLSTSLVNTLGIALPGLVPIGATVLLSTLLAHGIRDWLASLFSKRQRSMRN